MLEVINQQSKYICTTSIYKFDIRSTQSPIFFVFFKVRLRSIPSLLISLTILLNVLALLVYVLLPLSLLYILFPLIFLHILLVFGLLLVLLGLKLLFELLFSLFDRPVHLRSLLIPNMILVQGVQTQLDSDGPSGFLFGAFVADGSNLDSGGNVDLFQF